VIETVAAGSAIEPSAPRSRAMCLKRCPPGTEGAAATQRLQPLSCKTAGARVGQRDLPLCAAFQGDVLETVAARHRRCRRYAAVAAVELQKRRSRGSGQSPDYLVNTAPVHAEQSYLLPSW
jgi:hypothetical protein